MAIVPNSHALAKPWRKSARSGTGGCVEIALMLLVRPQSDLAVSAAEPVETDNRKQ